MRRIKGARSVLLSETTNREGGWPRHGLASRACTRKVGEGAEGKSTVAAAMADEEEDPPVSCTGGGWRGGGSPGRAIRGRQLELCRGTFSWSPLGCCWGNLDSRVPKRGAGLGHSQGGRSTSGKIQSPIIGTSTQK